MERCSNGIKLNLRKKKLKWNTFYDIILRESGNQFSQTKLLFGFNITMKLISFFFSFWNKYWLSLWHCTFCSPKSAMMQLFKELQKLDLLLLHVSVQKGVFYDIRVGEMFSYASQTICHHKQDWLKSRILQVNWKMTKIKLTYYMNF